jgi:hypothetical protein
MSLIYGMYIFSPFPLQMFEAYHCQLVMASKLYMACTDVVGWLTARLIKAHHWCEVFQSVSFETDPDWILRLWLCN